jgi:hypothetical protein
VNSLSIALLIVGAAGAGAVIARSLTDWLTSRRSDTKITITTPKGEYVLDTGSVRTASDIEEILRKLLDEDTDTVTVPITIYLADESASAQVEAAVEKLFTAAGGHIERRDEPVQGSWFRRLWGKLRSSPHGDDMLATAAHAVDARLFLTQDATITSTMLQNLGPVLIALQPTDNAVIRAGALLIVKVNGVLAVHQLTAAQQLKLDHQPQLAQSPHDILTALELPPTTTTSPNGLTSASDPPTPLSPATKPEDRSTS